MISACERALTFVLWKAKSEAEGRSGELAALGLLDRGTLLVDMADR